jgi:hypothetical protein
MVPRVPESFVGGAQAARHSGLSRRQGSRQGAVEMSDCLHCDINEIVEKHLEASESVDVVELAARMAESLAELIAFVAPEEERDKVLAHTIAHLGEMYIEKCTSERDTKH